MLVIAIAEGKIVQNVEQLFPPAQQIDLFEAIPGIVFEQFVWGISSHDNQVWVP